MLRYCMDGNEDNSEWCLSSMRSNMPVNREVFSADNYCKYFFLYCKCKVKCNMYEYRHFEQTIVLLIEHSNACAGTIVPAGIIRN